MNYGKQISKKKKEQDEIVYALTDVKERVVTKKSTN